MPVIAITESASTAGTDTPDLLELRDRVADCFRAQGKQWNATMEKKVKFAVANALPEDPNVALNEHKRSSLDALVSAIETLIN